MLVDAAGGEHDAGGIMMLCVYCSNCMQLYGQKLSASPSTIMSGQCMWTDGEEGVTRRV